MAKYVVMRCSVHEGTIDIVKGDCETYDEAQAVLDKDVDETADGWEGVSPDSVNIINDCDGTATVKYCDETFIWSVGQI